MLEKLRKAWCAETAHPSYRDKWSPENPSSGQCAVTALVVQDLFGGNIYSCKVGKFSHFINIIDDKIYDLTAEQFGSANQICYMKNSFKLRSRESLLRNKDVASRYALLKSRLEAILCGNFS